MITLIFLTAGMLHPQDTSLVLDVYVPLSRIRRQPVPLGSGTGGAQGGKN